MARSHRLGSLFSLSLVIGALAVVGCGAASNGDPSGGAVAENTNAQPAVAVDAEKEHVPFLSAAEKLDGLTADQHAQLAAVRADLAAAVAPRRAAMNDLRELFAKSLEAGKMDAGVDAKIAELQTLATAEADARSIAIDKVHAILGADQRAALVEAMKAKFEGMKEKWAGKKEGHHGGFAHGMLKELSLTDAQRAAFHDALAHAPKEPFAHGDFAAKMKAAGDAFKSDSFAAKTDLPAHPAMHEGFGAHMQRFVAVAIDVLDASQRAQLAKKIRAHAAE